MNRKVDIVSIVFFILLGVIILSSGVKMIVGHLGGA